MPVEPTSVKLPISSAFEAQDVLAPFANLPLPMKNLLLSLIVTALPILGWAEEVAPVVNLDPQRVAWRSIQLDARKFFFKASTTATLQMLPSGSVVDQLLESDKGIAVPLGPEVLQVESWSKFVGRESRLRLYMQPTTGQAIQYAQDRYGKRMRHRIYRYTEAGIFVRTHKPANPEQETLSWESWTDISTDWRELGPQAAEEVVVDPMGLIYFIAAADLSPGDPPIKILSTSDRKLSRVTLTAVASDPLKLKFDLNRPGGSLQCKGKVPAIKIRVVGESLTAEAGEPFEFLGLHGDIDMLLEPESRIVLQFNGKAPMVGDVTVKLKQATVVSDQDCPSA